VNERTSGILDALGLAAALGALFWLLSMARCTPAVAPNPDPSCVGACAQLEVLGCPEAGPSPGGIPCPGWCSRYHAVGYMRPWAECVAASTSVGDVRACGVKCGG
jgi:hypothetical protein